MVLIDRTSTPSQHLQSMDSLSAAQNRMARLQEQVSSGKAFQRASEDPSATRKLPSTLILVFFDSRRHRHKLTSSVNN